MWFILEMKRRDAGRVSTLDQITSDMLSNHYPLELWSRCESRLEMRDIAINGRNIITT